MKFLVVCKSVSCFLGLAFNGIDVGIAYVQQNNCDSPSPLMGEGWGEGVREEITTIITGSFSSRHLDAPINILKSHDVIFAQILAALHFNHDQIHNTRIF